MLTGHPFDICCGSQHTVVDWPASGHGGQTWFGGAGLLNLPDKSHFIGDAFPSSDVQRDVLRNATQIALIEKCGGPCGDDGWITMHSPQGEFNINLLTREFSVKQGDGSYFQGTAPSPGAQSVQAVSGNLPQQNLPKP